MVPVAAVSWESDHQVEDEPDPGWLGRADVAAGLAVGRPRWTRVRPPRPVPTASPSCADVADAHPDVRFVLDHGGKPPIAGGGTLDHWHADITRIARRPNVAVKLSGLVTEADWTSWTAADLAPVVDHLLDSFGADRTMFGSDWPVCELAADYGAVLAVAEDLTSGLSRSERDALFSETARVVYGLSPT